MNTTLTGFIWIMLGFFTALINLMSDWYFVGIVMIITGTAIAWIPRLMKISKPLDDERKGALSNV